MPERPLERRRRFPLPDPAAALAIFGAALEIAQWWAARPLWLDEEMIAVNIRDRSLSELTGTLWLGQSAPFGWLALQRVVMLLLGRGEMALRLVPVLFGLGTIAVALWIGRRWMSRTGAAVLVFLVVFGEWVSFTALEVKHYSADTFWAMLLPAGVAWAVESDDDDRRGVSTSRLAIWWGLAAVGQWFANGALLVAPGCAVVLLLICWRRGGWSAARHAAIPGIAWVLSFAVHYQLVLRQTLSSGFLQAYWAFALPPAGSGVAATLSWLAAQFQPFALKPGGASLWVFFWIASAAGLGVLIRKRPPLGLTFATVPLGACVLAAMRFVPLYERLSLWVIPSLYIGVAMFGEEAVRIAAESRRRSRVRFALAAAAAAIVVVVAIDIAQHGIISLRSNRPSSTNHQVNDRIALRWLLSQRHPGDDVATTRNSLPAVWWYGDVPVSGPYRGGGFAEDGGRVLELESRDPGDPICETNNTPAEIFSKGGRVLVYFGFRAGDEPTGYDDRVLSLLRERGSIVSDRRLRGFSRVTILELVPSRTPAPQAIDGTQDPQTPHASVGCIVVKPGERW